MLVSRVESRNGRAEQKMRLEDSQVTRSLATSKQDLLLLWRPQSPIYDDHPPFKSKYTFQLLMDFCFMALLTGLFGPPRQSRLHSYPSPKPFGHRQVTLYRPR